MKMFKIFALLVVILSFSACETYSDPKVEYSSIALMSGEWKVVINDPITKEDVKAVIYTYNTADESVTQMWLRIGTATAFNAKYGVRGKVDIDLNKKIFSVTDQQNAYLTKESKFSILNGTIVTGGATTPSGYKADAISFKLITETNPGVEYSVTGFRRTGWPEDE